MKELDRSILPVASYEANPSVELETQIPLITRRTNTSGVSATSTAREKKGGEERVRERKRETKRASYNWSKLGPGRDKNRQKQNGPKGSSG